MKLKIMIVVIFIVIGGGGIYYVMQNNIDKKPSRNSTRIVNNKATSTLKKAKKSSTQETSSVDSEIIDQTAMNIQQIKSGNFTSVIGTWQNTEGNTFVFDKAGLVSAKYVSSQAIMTNQKVYLKDIIDENGENYKVRSKIEDGILKASLGADPLQSGASALVPFYFLPKGTELTGTSDNTQDRLFTGQQFSDSNIYRRVENTQTSDAVTTTDKLTDNTKDALAILGIPSGFVSDYGKFNVNVLLSGQSEVSSNAYDKDNISVNNGKISNVSFSGVKIQTDGIKKIVRLNNISNSIDNVTYVEGYFTIDGDTITYKKQGTRLQGAEQDAHAETLGTASLSGLLKQYKSDSKLKKVESIIAE